MREREKRLRAVKPPQFINLCKKIYTDRTANFCVCAVVFMNFLISVIGFSLKNVGCRSEC